MGKVLGNHADDGDKRPRKSGALGAGFDAAFRGYINLALTQDQKDHYDEWAASASMWDALEAFTADGVNLSLKWQPKEECFLASGTQRREASPNAGLVVTARGKLAATAWGRLLFCLTILAHAEKWEDVQPLADPDRW